MRLQRGANGVPVGYAGWDTLGIVDDGCAYGSPFVAADTEVAAGLIKAIGESVRAVGARHLKITCRAGESAKLAALLQTGFVIQFEFVHFSHSVPLEGSMALPAALHMTALSELDWTRMHCCFAVDFNISLTITATRLPSRLFRSGSARIQFPLSALFAIELDVSAKQVP